MAIITTQNTGKDAKILLLAAKVMFFGGIAGSVLYPESADVAGAALVLSVPTYIVGRIVRWWRYS